VVDAVRDGLTNDDVGARNRGEVLTQRGEQVLLAALAHLEAHLDLGGMDITPRGSCFGLRRC